MTTAYCAEPSQPVASMNNNATLQLAGSGYNLLQPAIHNNFTNLPQQLIFQINNQSSQPINDTFRFEKTNATSNTSKTNNTSKDRPVAGTSERLTFNAFNDFNDLSVRAQTAIRVANSPELYETVLQSSSGEKFNYDYSHHGPPTSPSSAAAASSPAASNKSNQNRKKQDIRKINTMTFTKSADGFYVYNNITLKVSP